MIFLVHYLKKKREIKSLRSHQPNTENLGFHRGNPMYLTNGSMVRPLDVIIERFPLQEKTQRQKTHLTVTQLTPQRTRLGPSCPNPKVGLAHSPSLPVSVMEAKAAQPWAQGQWPMERVPALPLSTCVTLSKSLSVFSIT